MSPSSQGFEPLQELWVAFVRHAPAILLFVAIVVAGILFSALARRLTRWAARKVGVDVAAERLGVAKLLYALGVRQGFAHVLGTAVWIGGLLLTLAAAAEFAGLSAVAGGVAVVISFMPRLMAAAVVMMVGASFAALVRNLLLSFARARADVEHPEGIAHVSYYLVLGITIIMAASQAGLDTDLLDRLLTLLVALGGGAVAFAFAAGSRPAFTNLIAGHYLARLAKPGERITVDGIDGVVERYAGTSVVIRTESGDSVAVACDRIYLGHVTLRKTDSAAR